MSQRNKAHFTANMGSKSEREEGQLERLNGIRLNEEETKRDTTDWMKCTVTKTRDSHLNTQV